MRGFPSSSGVLSLLLLAGCSNGLCVQVDAVPPDTQSCAATPAPVEHLGSFQVGTRFLGPSLGQITSEQSMADAALLALRLAAGPGPLLLSGGTASLGPAEQTFRQQMRAQVMQQEAAIEDQRRALVEIGKRLVADTDPDNPNAAPLATQSLLTAYLARRPRLLLDTLLGPAPTHPTPETPTTPAVSDPTPSSAPATEGAKTTAAAPALAAGLPAVAPRRAVAERPPPRVVTSGFPVLAPHVAANPPASSAPVVVARVAAERVHTLPPPAVRSIRLLAERRP